MAYVYNFSRTFIIESWHIASILILDFFLVLLEVLNSNLKSVTQRI